MSKKNPKAEDAVVLDPAAANAEATALAQEVEAAQAALKAKRAELRTAKHGARKAAFAAKREQGKAAREQKNAARKAITVVLRGFLKDPTGGTENVIDALDNYAMACEAVGS